MTIRGVRKTSSSVLVLLVTLRLKRMPIKNQGMSPAEKWIFAICRRKFAPHQAARNCRFPIGHDTTTVSADAGR